VQEETPEWIPAIQDESEGEWIPAIQEEPQVEITSTYVSNEVFYTLTALLASFAVVFGIIHLKTSRKSGLLESYNKVEDEEKAKEVKSVIAKIFGESNEDFSENYKRV